jgi:pyruvate,water dikinase
LEGDGEAMTTDMRAPLDFPVTHRETLEDARAAPKHPSAGTHDPWVVAWFGDLSRGDVARVGGKGANLGELTTAGLPVPPGFVVTADAYLRALDQAGTRQELRRRVEGLDVDDPAALAEAAADCQACVRNAGMPDAVRHAVLDAYAQLGRGEGVAVRSSATAEDTASTSFAGMNETFTNVSGESELVDPRRRLLGLAVEPPGGGLSRHPAARR